MAAIANSINSPFLYQNNQVFTASGNFSVPANVTRVFVECWGAGGGGGAKAAGGTSGMAGSGGGGAYAAGYVNVTPGASVPVVIGAGGLGGVTLPSDGGVGGDTKFNTTSIVAKGGLGGIGATTPYFGGAGGAAASCTGDIKINGGAGGRNSNADATNTIAATKGGSSPRMQFAPTTGSGTTAVGTTDPNSGQGGTAGRASAGTDGATGYCVVWY